jgi:DNA-directed RNA polymerase specialized sigma24 family protein
MVLSYCPAYQKVKASILSEDIPLLIPEGFVSVSKNPDAIGIRNLVSHLVKEEKEIIELMYFSGYTQREIAEITDTPLGTIKTRVSRAIRNLRPFFKDNWEEASQYVSLN